MIKRSTPFKILNLLTLILLCSKGLVISLYEYILHKGVPIKMWLNQKEIRRQKRYLQETSTAKKSIKKEIVLTKLAINF